MIERSQKNGKESKIYSINFPLSYACPVWKVLKSTSWRAGNSGFSGNIYWYFKRERVNKQALQS